MIEFGKTLRAAREAKGLSVTQVAETTRMAPSRINELENEDFSRIVAPIYGRGFVKLYCEAVGLEPKPMVDEFMAIYNGDYDINIKDRPTTKSQAQETVQEPLDLKSAKEPEPSALEEIHEISGSEPPMASLDLFASAKEAMPKSAIKNASAIGNSFAKYAGPIRHFQMPKVSAKFWRCSVLVVGALIILAMLAIGIRALYRATSRIEASESRTASAPVIKPVTKPAANRAANKRTPQKIPSLYID